MRRWVSRVHFGTARGFKKYPNRRYVAQSGNATVADWLFNHTMVQSHCCMVPGWRHPYPGFQIWWNIANWATFKNLKIEKRSSVKWTLTWPEQPRGIPEVAQLIWATSGKLRGCSRVESRDIRTTSIFFCIFNFFLHLPCLGIRRVAKLNKVVMDCAAFGLFYTSGWRLLIENTVNPSADQWPASGRPSAVDLDSDASGVVAVMAQLCI